MTPIEQIRPALPGNWTRRPEDKQKPARRVREKPSQDKNRREDRPDDRPNQPAHHVDDFA